MGGIVDSVPGSICRIRHLFCALWVMGWGGERTTASPGPPSLCPEREKAEDLGPVHGEPGALPLQVQSAEVEDWLALQWPFPLQSLWILTRTYRRPGNSVRVSHTGSSEPEEAQLWPAKKRKPDFGKAHFSCSFQSHYNNTSHQTTAVHLGCSGWKSTTFSLFRRGFFLCKSI